MINIIDSFNKQNIIFISLIFLVVMIMTGVLLTYISQFIIFCLYIIIFAKYLSIHSSYLSNQYIDMQTCKILRKKSLKCADFIFKQIYILMFGMFIGNIIYVYMIVGTYNSNYFEFTNFIRF